MTRFTDLESWNVSDEEYYAGIGSSTICRALGKDGPGETTSDVGNATHIAVLQPDIFEDRVVCPPEDCRRGSGKGQQSRLADWEKENAGKLILSPSEYESVLEMRNALRGRKILAWLRSKGVLFEQSFRATDQITGLTVRVRPDALLGRKSQDLKTSQSPDFDGFSRAIKKYYYHVQAALYSDVLGLTDWHWLVVGNKRPYRTALYRCPEKWIELGRRLYSAGLTLISASMGQRPRAWWEERPLELEEPRDSDELEVKLHEQHAERVVEQIARAS